MTTSTQILQHARQLIDSADKWTTNCYARDRFHRDVGYHSPAAVRFCLHGAVRRAAMDLPKRRTTDAYMTEDAAMARVEEYMAKDESLEDFNDARGRTHDEVLSLLDRAIAGPPHLTA